MDANTVYGLLNFICNKSQNGDISPDEYTLLMRSAQAQYMAFLLGEFEQYQYGRPIARVSLGQHQRVYESLSPFFKDTILNINGGAAPKPDDWEATVSIRSLFGSKDYRFTTRSTWNNWANSVIDPVADNPIYTFGSGDIQLAPASLAQATMTYVMTPPDTIWAYTLDSDGLPVYDASNSVGLKWLSKDCFSVIARALRMVGIHLQASAVLQFANEITTKGQ